jgi:hypothetical protein
MKDTTKTAPAPTAKPAANEDVGCGVATATTAPAARRPKRRGRETATGGTDGIIGAWYGYYDRLKNKERQP